MYTKTINTRIMKFTYVVQENSTVGVGVYREHAFCKLY